MKNLIFGINSLLFLFFTACQTPTSIPLSVPPIFSDHMVIQQNQSIAFWGKYTPNQTVKIEGNWGETISVDADEAGDWQGNLDSPAAGGPYEIQITTKDSTIVVSDVLSGEVWLASGQSNMQMSLLGYLPNEPIDNNEAEVAAANYPMMREFFVQRALAVQPEEEYVGEWKVTSPETASERSATAYFFARKVHETLGIPVGIIHSSWGGTPVESWMSREKLLALNEFEQSLSALEPQKVAAIENWFDQFPTKPIPSKLEEWNELELEDSNYMAENFDDSAWGEAKLTTAFEELDGPGSDGAVWFRKKVELTDISSDYSFNISGGIDDSDIAYVNGERIGATVCYNCPRSYTIPKSVLKKGSNTFAIRAIDTGGPGGARGDVFLAADNGRKISVDADWRYLHIAGLKSSKFLLFQANPELANNPPQGLDDYNLNANTPSVLFNAMINPLIPYTIKGALWYQGESNVGRHDQYLKLFPGMIEDWRDRWDSDFPFYFVQIAPFNYGNGLSPALRDAQRKSLHLANTGMAIAMDVGSASSIHPGNKQDVGDRLARLALSKDYGQDIVASGPLYKGHMLEGNQVILNFDHLGSGLIAEGGELTNFEVAGEDGKFVVASAKIMDNQVIVNAESVSKPMSIRYGWKDYLEPTLFNKEGLPASSFSVSW